MFSFKNSKSCAFDNAPTLVAATLPSLNNNNVGISVNGLNHIIRGNNVSSNTLHGIDLIGSESIIHANIIKHNFDGIQNTGTENILTSNIV